MYSRVDVLRKLEEKGLSKTQSRVEIALFIFNAKHPTTENIVCFAKRNFPKLNLATVYNVVHDLEEKGLIKKLKFSHLSQMVYDVNVYDHYHFLDVETGEILDIDIPEKEIPIPTLPSDLEVDSVEVVFKGKRKKP